MMTTADSQGDGGGSVPQSSPGAAALISKATNELAAAGVPTPRNDARLLLAEAYGVEPRDVDKAVLLGEHIAVSSSAVIGCNGRFDAMVARRCSREPLQYIVGHAPFRYLDLQVGPGVFIPRPETETVVQSAIDWLDEQQIDSPRLVDLCAGSGAIGLALATEVPNAQVWAVEQSDQALVWTLRNVRGVLGGESVRATAASSPSLGVAALSTATASQPLRYHLVRADATDPGTLSDQDGTIDAVVTNPPYVPCDEVPSQPEVRDYDPEMALYGGSGDGLRIPELIVLRAAALLRQGGLLMMEHDISQAASLVEFARAHGFADANTGDDLTGRPRYLRACKG